MNKVPRILIIPARRHIIEAYCEYLIRHLSDEFYFEMGYPPEPPYYNILERVYTGATSPLEKNPDDFDLIYPHFDTHWFLDPPEKYQHKIASVLLEPVGVSGKRAVIAGTSPSVEEKLPNPYHSLRFGVDTMLFRPYPMVRTDNLLHVGFIGNIGTPRRYMKELFMPLKSMSKVRLMIFPVVWWKHTRPDEIEGMGGQDMLTSIVDGDKWYPGLPNLYNQMDIFIRCDIDHGYQFSVMEAASCGVPVICTDSGNTKQLCDAGGGICIDTKDRDVERIAIEIQAAVKYLRDNPEIRKEMGRKGREFVEENYVWKKFIPAWRKFFREGVTNAQKM